jgi:invasion protein IalB
MILRIAAPPAWPVARTVFTAAAILAVVGTSWTLAQQRAAPKQTAPAAQKGQAAAPPAQAVQPDLIYAPWTKLCVKGQEPKAKQVCYTGKDVHLETGVMAAAAVLVETENDPKKVLRVTLPLGMQLVQGTRMIIDDGRPALGPYLICFTNGCMAEYDASTQLINRLKKGQLLAIQGINANGQAINVNLPLSDFAKAHDGPPLDPKVFEERQQKLNEELQRRTNEVRERLERLQVSEPGGR